MHNLYWPVYLNLERELLSISEIIHVDDSQLEVYSMKIAELLIRTAIEIESIAKALYFSNGGSKADDNHLYFDSDCMDHLVNIWDIDKKVVLVTSPNLFFTHEDNLILTPLNKANKRGSKSAKWCRAYQAVKHNRAKELKNGNLKHFIHALGALYILNLYFRDEKKLYSTRGEIIFNDFSFGSKVFSVLEPNNIGRRSYDDGRYYKGADFDKHVYVAVPDETQYREIVNIHKTLREQAQKILLNELSKVDLNSNRETFKEDVLKRLQTIENDLFVQNASVLGTKSVNLSFTAELNKNQPFLYH